MISFYKKEIAILIQNAFPSLNQKEISNLISKPPKKEMGDYSFPCFKLAGNLKKDPKSIAKDFILKYTENKYFSKVESLGPYINFSLEKQNFIHSILEWALAINENSFQKIGKNKTVVIDFSSPNIAKPFSIAHLRSTSIGNSLYKIFSFLGYKVVGINHIGDWGTSFGKLISAYIRWGENINLNEEPIKKLLELYIKFHKETKIDKTLEEEGKLYFKKLEDGNQKVLNIWNNFKNLSLEEFKRIYELLNVSFDHYTPESFYREKISPVVKEIKDKKIAVKSQGALVVPLKENNMPPFLLQKEDGASLYGTRDITAAIYRKKTFDFDEMLYVVGSEQKLYFKQLFKVLEIMGYSLNCEHIKFGLMHFKEGKMSTREGKIIFLEDVIEKAKQKAIIKLNQNEIENKGEGKEEKREGKKENKLTEKEKEELASKIAVSSIVFFDLKNTREKDCIFDWEEVLNPKGETGIYLQYAHARLCGILRNFEKNIGRLPEKSKEITENASFELVEQIAGFEEKIIQSKKEREPSIIARFAIELSQKFSSYYKQYQVVNKGNHTLSYERITSVIASKKILAFSMKLLGIEPLEKI